MPFYYTPYILLPLVSAVINGGLACYAWKRRRVAEAQWLFWVLAGLALWDLSYTLNIAATNMWLKNLFFKCGSSSTLIVVYAFVPMTLMVTGHAKRCTRITLLVLALVPILSLLLTWTNDFHGLIRNHQHLDSYAGLLLIDYSNGDFFKHIHLQYVYLVMLCMTLLCLWGLFTKNQIRRGSLAAIVCATVVPVLIDILNISPVKELRFTTSTHWFSGLCYCLAVFYGQMINLVPIAQSTLFRQMKEPVLVLDNEGRLSDHNQAAQKLLALPADAVGISLDALYPPNHPLHGLLLIDSESIRHDREGMRWWQISHTQLRYGMSFIGWVLVLHDVTSLYQSQKNLRISEERFRRLSEDSADIIWELDADMSFKYVNDSDRVMRGFQPEEVLGKPVFTFLRESDTATIKTSNAKRLRQEQQGIKTDALRHEVQMLCKDGSYLWTEVVSSPLRDPDGHLVGYIGVTRDISKRKAEQQCQQEILEYEQELRKEQESFLTMISHEYRTPLAIIQNNLNLIELIEADFEKRYDSQIATMKQAILRLVDILEISLELLRMGTAYADTAKKRLTLSAFLDEVIDKAEAYWPDRVFVYQPQSTSEAVLGNPIQLTTTLLNLLDNACKYSPERTPIIIADYTDSTMATVTVTNQGAGLSADEVDLLFEKFQRGGNSSGTSGTGIGLWLAMRIAKQHGGSIKMELGSGEAIHVSLRLPIQI